MSALSDTTNLAPAVAGTDLFSHIRHMVWTTGPSFAVAVTLFTIAGFVAPTPATTEALANMTDALQREFAIGPLPLLPVAVVLPGRATSPGVPGVAGRHAGRRRLRRNVPAQHGNSVRGGCDA